jgi:hypothetical protein
MTLKLALHPRRKNCRSEPACGKQAKLVWQKAICQ